MFILNWENTESYSDHDHNWVAVFDTIEQGVEYMEQHESEYKRDEQGWQRYLDNAIETYPQWEHVATKGYNEGQVDGRMWLCPIDRNPTSRVS